MKRPLGKYYISAKWPTRWNGQFGELSRSKNYNIQLSLHLILLNLFSKIFPNFRWNDPFLLFSLCNPSHAWQQQHSIKRWGKYGKLRRVGRGSRWSVYKSRVSSQRIARIHTADEVLDELRESEEWTRKWAYAGRVRRLNATLWDVGWVGSGWWCCCVYTQIHLWLTGEVGSSTSIERYSSWASLAKWR